MRCYWKYFNYYFFLFEEVFWNYLPNVRVWSNCNVFFFKIIFLYENSSEDFGSMDIKGNKDFQLCGVSGPQIIFSLYLYFPCSCCSTSKIYVTFAADTFPMLLLTFKHFNMQIHSQRDTIMSLILETNKIGFWGFQEVRNPLKSPMCCTQLYAEFGKHLITSVGKH